MKVCYDGCIRCREEQDHDQEYRNNPLVIVKIFTITALSYGNLDKPYETNDSLFCAFCFLFCDWECGWTTKINRDELCIENIYRWEPIDWKAIQLHIQGPRASTCSCPQDQHWNPQLISFLKFYPQVTVLINPIQSSKFIFLSHLCRMIFHCMKIIELVQLHSINFGRYKHKLKSVWTDIHPH